MKTTFIFEIFHHIRIQRDKILHKRIYVPYISKFRLKKTNHSIKPIQFIEKLLHLIMLLLLVCHDYIQYQLKMCTYIVSYRKICIWKEIFHPFMFHSLNVNRKCDLRIFTFSPLSTSTYIYGNIL